MNNFTPSSPATQTQDLYHQYSTNHFLPTINWQKLFPDTPITDAEIIALQSMYQAAIPLALSTLKTLNVDVFAAPEKKPQGLGLFEKLRAKEDELISSIAAECEHLSHEARHAIWSMLLRGGAVLVFKAWLGKVKTGKDQLDLSYFAELADLLWLRTDPIELAKRLNVDYHANLEHLFLLYQDRVLLDRFNNLQTAALFAKLGVCDPVFMSLHDAHIRDHFLSIGLITKQQLDEEFESLNPMYTDLPEQAGTMVKNYH